VEWLAEEWEEGNKVAKDWGERISCAFPPWSFGFGWAGIGDGILAMSEQVYLGIDLGAESGRVMAGAWNGKAMRVEELHRFSNGPVYVAETLRWDVLRLWTEIQNGLAIAAKRFGDAIVSVGVDTWGVDFVLLSKNGEMLGQPYHYRDGRVAGMFEEAFRRISRE
jgi:rhamnulokinase